MSLDLSKMEFGITSTVDLEIVRELAPRLERAGFQTLWINHAGGGSALASMETAASVTSRLRLGSGVVPVDKMPVAELVSDIRQRDLPLDRCIVGIGASAEPSPLTTVRDATATLHRELGAKVYVGALGPNMRKLAVTEADGELLNWLTPDAARLAVAEKDTDMEDADSDHHAGVSLYIRVALGSDAHPVLEREAARYENIPSYAANFGRLGISSLEASVYGETATDVRAGLARYSGVVDEAVVRAITAHNTLDEFVALASAVAG